MIDGVFPLILGSNRQHEKPMQKTEKRARVAP